jgi:hypothetical protein
MTYAIVPPDHPSHQLITRQGDFHLGIYYGRAKPHHGRLGESFIISTAGTEVFSFEFPDIDEGSRVRYRLGFPGNAISAMAIDVRPVDPPKVTKAKNK